MDYRQFIHPMWEKYNEGIARDFAEGVPHDFLRHPAIEGTMHTRGASYTPRRLEWLKSVCDDHYLRTMLAEKGIGDPHISVPEYNASDVTVGHLYHLETYRAVTGNAIGGDTIIEWGGGYGNLARMVKYLNPQCTYIIIDTPVMCAVQEYYLRHFVDVSTGAQIKQGAVNIIPLTSLDALNVTASAFISTWALTECTEYAGEYVKARNWYGAYSFLFAYCPGSPNVKAISSVGGVVVPCDGLPPNEYMFK